MPHKGGAHQTKRVLVSETISYLKTPVKVIEKINLPNIELQRKSNLPRGVLSLNFGEFFRKNKRKERKHIKCDDCSLFNFTLFSK